jgi:hypothetical protein|tara:strand:+ start:13 stop:513 length:501 start_codon:yes stop_codon:yes gene_type:complete
MATTAKLNIIEGNQVTSLVSGNMYFYKYKAEPTEILYDRFPLIFMIRKKGMLFEGINFHYIPVKWRMPLFEDMKIFFDSDEIADDTRLRVRAFRNLIMSNRKYRFAKASLKRYKRENIRSKMIMIPPTEWEKAILQPAEMFIAGTGKRLNTKVIHRETLLRVRGKR